MKRLTLRFRYELYLRVRLMANQYGMSINKMIIKLIEMGYIKMLGGDSNE